MLELTYNDKMFIVKYEKKMIFSLSNIDSVKNDNMSIQFVTFNYLSVLLINFGLFDDVYFDNAEYF